MSGKAILFFEMSNPEEETGSGGHVLRHFSKKWEERVPQPDSDLTPRKLCPCGHEVADPQIFSLEDGKFLVDQMGLHIIQEHYKQIPRSDIVQLEEWLVPPPH